jgi:hypothetical protein
MSYASCLEHNENRRSKNLRKCTSARKYANLCVMDLGNVTRKYDSVRDRPDEAKLKDICSHIERHIEKAQKYLEPVLEFLTNPELFSENLIRENEQLMEENHQLIKENKQLMAEWLAESKTAENNLTKAKEDSKQLKRKLDRRLEQRDWEIKNLYARLAAMEDQYCRRKRRK